MICPGGWSFLGGLLDRLLGLVAGGGLRVGKALYLAHDLVGKPVPTFPDHAL
jgi:hypothetical protein